MRRTRGMMLPVQGDAATRFSYTAAMTTHDTPPPPSDEVAPTAILVGVQTQGVTSEALHSSLDELERLVKTLGMRVVGRMTQARGSTGNSAVLGKGKLRALAARTGGSGVVPMGAERRQTGALPKGPEDEAPWSEPENWPEEGDATVAAPPNDEPIDDDWAGGDTADVVVFDQELTPTQLRNLTGATGAEVLDRSAVILGIFQRHARTREAKLQVEIARLVYLAPRLRASGGGGDRQRGGIGGKGAGESAVELDRRRARDRISALRTELVVVQRSANTRRARRDERATVALVGYTNAGKSSIMRGLTGSEVLVRDQLFATLDTTVRRLDPPSLPPIFISDTVGFIKKLPHDLVASFRSTLQEAREADLVLFVVDVADPAWRSHLDVTRTALGEVGAGDLPGLLVMNKADRLLETQRQSLLMDYPDAVLLSAHQPADMSRLRTRLITFFERDMVEEEIFIAYAQAKWVHRIHKAARVLDERHDNRGTHLRVRAKAQDLLDLRAKIATDPT